MEWQRDCKCHPEAFSTRWIMRFHVGHAGAVVHTIDYFFGKMSDYERRLFPPNGAVTSSFHFIDKHSLHE